MVGDSILSWWSLSLRSINYDEKDPFLCNACGFCKYARFDFMLYARPCCAVDPIENEEDRKKVSRRSCVNRPFLKISFHSKDYF